MRDLGAPVAKIHTPKHVPDFNPLEKPLIVPRLSHLFSKEAKGMRDFGAPVDKIHSPKHVPDFNPSTKPTVRDVDVDVLPNRMRGGFTNLGNTCYMNAVLEALCCITSFSRGTRRLPILNQLPPESFTLAIYRLMNLRKTQDSGESLNLSNIKKALEQNGDRFLGFEQQDAHEFLCACFDQMELEITPFLSIQTNPSFSTQPFDIPATATFRGVIQYQIVCKGCQDTETRDEDFFFLSLPLPDEDEDLFAERPITTIRSALNCFFEDEKVERSCSKCPSKKAVRHTSFSRLPLVLVIQLQRFRFSMTTSAPQKVDTRVSIEQELNLSKTFSCGLSGLANTFNRRALFNQNRASSRGDRAQAAFVRY